MAIAFYSSASLVDAYKSLKKILAVEDLQFLKEFHAHYQKKVAPLLLESRSLMTAQKKLNKALQHKGIAELFQETENFYRVKGDIEYRVLLGWWPPIKRTLATPVGNFLVLRYNPIEHLKDLENGTDIVFHEIVHTISARQDLNQKQEVTKQFLQECQIYNKLQKKEYEIFEKVVDGRSGSGDLVMCRSHRRSQSDSKNLGTYGFGH